MIKNFSKIREYMRDFYVYGFRTRMEFDRKSPRSYDDDRRRIESWLGDYMAFRQTESGKNIFISVDSRDIEANPLFAAFKTKSFTDKDITLFFYVMDLLEKKEESWSVQESEQKLWHESYQTRGLTIAELCDGITDTYLHKLGADLEFDISTLRKKMKEFEALGLVRSYKKDNKHFYVKNCDAKLDELLAADYGDALSFYSEIAPIGVIGTFLLERQKKDFAQLSHFTYKHHYILKAFDSEIVYQTLEAMNQRRFMELVVTNKFASEVTLTVCPMKILLSTAQGRYYVAVYNVETERFHVVRVDNVQKVKLLGEAAEYDRYREEYAEFSKHMWGVAINEYGKTEHIEMDIHVEENELFLVKRLEREKRCGQIRKVDETTWRYAADVYDAQEMLPWIRTFTGRIIRFASENKALEERFYQDLESMYRMYEDADGVGADGRNADGIKRRR